MIVEDAANFQKQLVHLFRVFEVDVAVSAGLIDKNDDWGITLTSTDPQLRVITVEPPQLPKKQRAKRPKDVLSG